ncbi:MAG TPA: TfoX/Sxy family protein [Thermoplasmata archaeon]|nr:TfoX/Sxy family protein [Thermoplasmata archaeon]
MKIEKPTPEAIALLKKLTPKDPRVEVRLVFGNPAAFVQGNMFMGVYGSKLFFRLSVADLELGGSLPGAGPFEPMPGHAMSGYLALPTEILDQPKVAREWVGRALRFGAQLPEKKRKGR